MKKEDLALSFPNPRLISAIYFGLLSVVGTILSNALLSMFSIEQLVPLHQAILWGMIVSSLTGAIMGKTIIYTKEPYRARVFLIGFAMVIITLPLFDLGILYLIQASDQTLFLLPKSNNFLVVYLSVVGYSYLLFGILLAIASGLAAMYLRAVLVYNVLDTYETKEERRKAKKQKATKNKE